MIKPPIILPTAFGFHLLLILPLIAAVVFITNIILKRTPDYQKDSGINNQCICIAVFASLFLYIRFGLTTELLKGLMLFFIYLYASVCDIRTRNVADAVSVCLILLGFVGTKAVSWIFGTAAALVVFLFMLDCAVFSGNKIGGADVKFIPASVFVLGISKGIAGLITGLLFAVIGTALRNKIRKTKDKTLPLIPYLSAGFFISYFI